MEEKREEDPSRDNATPIPSSLTQDKNGWVTAYLAGPDVFLPNASENAKQKIAICAEFCIIGRAPLNEAAVRLPSMSDQQFAYSIYLKDIKMMDSADIIIANLTPFRGVSADSGTLIEVGYCLGKNKPIFGYSNSASNFSTRCQRHIELIPDEVTGLALEGLGQPDNLMITGAVLTGGGIEMITAEEKDEPFDSLKIFRICVERAAKALREAGKLNAKI